MKPTSTRTGSSRQFCFPRSLACCSLRSIREGQPAGPETEVIGFGFRRPVVGKREFRTKARRPARAAIAGRNRIEDTGRRTDTGLTTQKEYVVEGAGIARHRELLVRPGSASFDVIQGTTPRIANPAGYSRKPVELVMTSRIEQCIGGKTAGSEAGHLVSTGFRSPGVGPDKVAL
jgi:hypothetical protein